MNIQALEQKDSQSVSFYDIIDRTATYDAGKDMMDVSQAKRKKAGIKGGITGYTYDLFYAVLRSVAPTMEDIKKKQPELYDQCEEHGEYFCFTTIPTLIKKMNDTGQRKHAVPSKKTIFNQLKKLMDIGIITEKKNYKCTGLRNPYPSEESAGGRGKIQLWISPKILQFKPEYTGSRAISQPSFFVPLEKELPQYRTSSLSIINKEPKTINNTPADVNKVASTVVESNPSHIQDKEQESKPNLAVRANIPPANFSKNQFFLEKLWSLFRFNLYGDQDFNNQTKRSCQEILQGFIEKAEQHVRDYKADVVRDFKQNPAFIASKNPNRLINNLQKSLPPTNEAALEIVSHAIFKQRKYSERKNNLDQLFYPVNYLNSTAAEKAFSYSVIDWQRIQDNYFQKNKTSKAYFDQINWINQRFSACLREIHNDGYQRAYDFLKRKYKMKLQELQTNPFLDKSKLEKLNDYFIHKFKPIFANEQFKRSSNVQEKT